VTISVPYGSVTQWRACTRLVTKGMSNSGAAASSGSINERDTRCRLTDVVI